MIGKFRELERGFAGEIVTAADAQFDFARRVWNGAVHNRPALIAKPTNTQDVSIVVRFANKNQFPLSVLGGGYDWAGRSVREGAIVVDLANLSDVIIDSDRQIATVGGGTRSRALLSCAGESHMTAIAGAAGDVGVAGFTMSGGYGPLTPSLGLGVDNLVAAEVVLADGSVQSVDEEQSKDLLWALRGGGGNFGVVTSLRLRLHPVQEVLVGKAMYAWKDSNTILQNYGDCMVSAPDELAATLALVTSPAGDPSLVLAPCWNGDPRQGQPEIKKLAGAAEYVHGQFSTMRPQELFSLFEASAKPGRRYAQQTRWLPTLDKGITNILTAAAAAKPSPYSAVALQSFHGAPTRVPSEATAFAMRRPHFLVSIVAAWEEDTLDADQRNRQWAMTVSRSLAPFALPGGYASLLGPDETDQLAQTYGPNLARLRRIKQQFDPQNRFSANGPIRV